MSVDDPAESTISSSDQPTVPEWWTPETADPETSKLYDPTVSYKHVEGTSVQTVLRDLAHTAEHAGCTLHPEPVTRNDGTHVGTGVLETGPITQYYQWSVSPREGYVEITEKRCWDSYWRYGEAVLQGSFAAALGTLYATGHVSLPSLVPVVLLFVFLLSLVAWVVIQVYGNRHGSCIADIDGVMQDSRSYSLSRIAFLGVSALVAGLSIISSDIFLLIGTVVALGGVAVSLWYQFRVPPVPDFSVVLPAGGAEYVLLSAVFGVPVGVITLYAREVLDLAFFLVILQVAISGAVGCGLVALMIFGGHDTVDAFRRGGARYVDSTGINVTLVFLGVTISWVSFAFWADTAQRALRIVPLAVQALDPAVVAGLVVLGVLALTPGAYLLTGLLGQAVGSVVATVRLADRCRRGVEPPADVQQLISTDIVVLPQDEQFATALWCGPYKRVIVSQGLVDGLSTEELQAIVAHEHAHVAEYNDAALGVVIPVVSTVLLVSQNIVLPLLDYRERELRADRYAAQVTSPSAVRSAIQTVATAGLTLDVDKESSTTTDPSGSAAVGFRAFPSAASGPSDGRSVFEPLFTAFQIAQAHPSVSDRLSSLDEHVDIENVDSDSG